ncbi:hypothetical protein ACSER3_11755 [Pseudomonas aeruginosa]
MKGDTYKDKVRKTEFTEDEDGNITEVRILTDRFIPIIRAWEMTPSSVNQGRVLTISSSAATTEEAEEPQPEPASAPLLFSPGQVVMTAAVSHLVETGQLNPAPLLNRHLAGDWGTLDQEDWNTNQRALKFGDRLLSSYDIDAGGESRLWIITEADRSSTTLLLPSDY